MKIIMPNDTIKLNKQTNQTNKPTNKQLNKSNNCRIYMYIMYYNGHDSKLVSSPLHHLLSPPSIPRAAH